MLAETVRTISHAEPPPLEVFRPYAKQPYRLDTLLDHRAISLRIPEFLDVFRVQAEILRRFRAYLVSQGFTEICTPKLVLAGAEGGAGALRGRVLRRKAYLAQSPQFYKQIMVGSGLGAGLRGRPRLPRGEKRDQPAHDGVRQPGLRDGLH